MNYYLLLKFGDKLVPVNPSVLKELTIIQNYNHFLPEIRLKLVDNSGFLTHVFPFDRSMSKIFVEIGESPNSINKNSFEFLVYERQPEGDRSLPSGLYDITGLLNIENMFLPNQTRSFNQNVKTTLETIAKTELKTDKSEVSVSLDYTKNLIQPSLSNIEFFKYLKENLIGSNKESNFKCFIKNNLGKSVFTFKSTTEMIKDQVKFKFVLTDKQYQDRLPILSYAIYDNYMVYGSFAGKKQSYGYYDYENSQYINADEQAGDFFSLTDYFAIDQNDSDGSVTYLDTGRSNDFTSDFKGRVRSSYHERLLSLNKMWITTIGLPNANPGQTVEIFFPYGVSSPGVYSYQYSGYWLVEKVVHSLSDIFITKLLLTRNGIDTDRGNTLVKATNKKKL